MASKICRALAKNYGRDDVVCSGPRLSQTLVGTRNSGTGTNAVTLRFEHAAAGLIAIDGKPLRHFEVAGPDDVYYSATAMISTEDRAAVLVWSTNVPQPVAVRYAWHEEAIGNLANSHGLPAGPFRTKRKPQNPQLV